MSLFMQAAARCDRKVASSAPVPVDTNALQAEDEARIEAAAAEEAAEAAARGAGLSELERLRREQTDERMEKIRSDQRRAIAVAGREKASANVAAEERAKGDTTESTRIERNRAERAAAERRRVMEIEHGRHDALRQQHSVYAEKGQQRIRGLDEKIGTGDVSILSASDKVRIDKERRQRIESAMGLNGSVSDLYKGLPTPLPNLPATGARRGQARVERLHAGLGPLRSRHAAEAAEIAAEEQAELEQEEQEQVQRRALKQGEAEAVVRRETERRKVMDEQVAQKMSAAEKLRLKVHPIDVLQRQIARDLIDEREEEYNDLDSYSGMDHQQQLDQYVDLEADAWREADQLTRQRNRVAAAV